MSKEKNMLKMSHLIQTILLMIILTLVKSQTNYCSLSTCVGGTHTMCRFPSATPASRCTNLTTISITAGERQKLLDIHNRLRQQVAAGRETRGNPGPQPASTNMPNLVWDDELATIAQRWANQCSYGHDTCRNVARFRVGQNIALYPVTDTVIETIMDRFYNEVALFNNAEVPRFLGRNLEQVGHYTQLVWGTTTTVGCGATRFINTLNNRPVFYLVCNYGPAGNSINERVYQTA